MNLFKEILDNKHVLLQLVQQYLKLKYRRSFLGYFWTLLNPLLMLFVLAIVFSALLKVEFVNFVLLLFAGLVPWNMFSGTVIQSLSTFINNENLIKKIYIPKILFPLSVSIATFIDSLIFFILIFPLTLVIGGKLTIYLFMLIPAFFLLFLFTLAISLISSLLTVYFRDFQWLIPVFMQALFFLTPILYDKSEIFGYLSWFNNINPITPFIYLSLIHI